MCLTNECQASSGGGRENGVEKRNFCDLKNKVIFEQNTIVTK